MIQALTRRVRRLIRRAFEGAGGGRRWEPIKTWGMGRRTRQ